MTESCVLAGWLIIQCYIGVSPEAYPKFTNEYLYQNRESIRLAFQEMEVIDLNDNWYFKSESTCIPHMIQMIERYEEIKNYPLLKENPNFQNLKLKGYVVPGDYHVMSAILIDYFQEQILMNPHQKDNFQQHIENVEKYKYKLYYIEGLNGDSFQRARKCLDNLKRIMSQKEYENEIFPELDVSYHRLYLTLQEIDKIKNKQLEEANKSTAKKFLKFWFGFAK